MNTITVTVVYTGTQAELTDSLNETLNTLEAAGTVLDWTYSLARTRGPRAGSPE